MGLWSWLRRRRADNFTVGPILEVRNVVPDVQAPNADLEPYLEQVSHSAAFHRLKHATNEDTAFDIATVIFNRTGHANNVTNDNMAPFVNGQATRLITKEATRAYEGREIIRLLWLRALKGELRSQIGHPTNRALPPLRAAPLQHLYNGYPRAENIACAVDWILGSSYTLNGGVSASDKLNLTQAMYRIIASKNDILTIDAMDSLSWAIGRTNFATRPLDAVTNAPNYGGTTLGRFLQADALSKARMMDVNIAGDPAYWTDVAAFMLVSIIRAQPYPDGNHRIASAYFASILIKNRMPFVLPNYSWIDAMRNNPFPPEVAANAVWSPPKKPWGK